MMASSSCISCAPGPVTDCSRSRSQNLIATFGDWRISQTMAEEMTAALETARQSRDVGACVLTGHGDVFCLGGDYWGAGRTSAGRHDFARAFIDMAQAMARLGKPLIAAINGNAHAGG